MNRATKRLMARQQAAAERPVYKRPTPVAPTEREPFFRRVRRFVRDVRGELKKVAWPTRAEVLVYTVVVLVTVTFLTFIVFGLDYGFAKAVLKVFRQ